MSTVEAGGVLISYDDLGQGDPALILAHGWCCDRSTLAPVAERLARSHRVLNVDLREHGQSAASAPYTSGDVVDDLVEVAAAAGVDRPVIVGHSLGAKFALEYSIRHPDKLRALVLLDTSIVETAERRARRMSEVESHGDAGALRKRVAAMFIDSDDEVLREGVITSMLAMPKSAAKAALVAGDMVDTASALREGTVPVLYIGGAREWESPDLMRDIRPDLVYHQITDSGHFVSLFAPDEVTAVIEGFLRDQVAD